MLHQALDGPPCLMRSPAGWITRLCFFSRNGYGILLPSPRKFLLMICFLSLIARRPSIFHHLSRRPGPSSCLRSKPKDSFRPGFPTKDLREPRSWPHHESSRRHTTVSTNHRTHMDSLDLTPTLPIWATRAQQWSGRADQAGE